MLLLLILLCPVIGALLVFAGTPARVTAMCAAMLQLVAAIVLAVAFEAASSGFTHVISFPINAEWGMNFTLGVDGLSLIMVVLSALVLFAAVWFAGDVQRHANAFYACLLLIAAGTTGAFLSLDLFFFYAFHELALIPTFLLIGIWGSGNRYAAAWKVTIYLATGSFTLLLGLILLYRSVPESMRTLDIRALQAAAASSIPAATQSNIFILLLIGFGILISLFPFHTWAPEAYASAPAPAAMLHAGVLKKFGLYGLLRIALPMLPAGAQHWTNLLIVLLLGNIIYVGLVTIAQKRLDWILGYSSVMHMGYIFLGIAAANALGTTGAAVLMFAHGLSISLLFGIAGEVRKRTGTLVLSELGGLARIMPFAGLTFGFAAFAAIGLPGFANFSAEVMVLFGAFANGADMHRFHIFQVATLLALWGVVISAVYMLRAYRAVFMGPLNENVARLPVPARTPRLPVVLLVGVSIFVGFFPQNVARLVAPILRAQTAQR